MVIGTNSRVTILEVLRTGVREMVRQQGLPHEMNFKTDNCEMYAKSADLSKRVEQLRIVFTPKEGVDLEPFRAEIAKAQIPHQIESENGSCALRLPGFEWRQLPQLVPVDTAIEKVALKTFRGQSWEVRVESFIPTDLNINVMIEQLQAMKGSDLHLRAGTPPYVRIDSDLKPLDMPALNSEDMRRIVFQLGGETEVSKLEAERESSFQYHSAGVGYLRCSGYYKMGAMALAIRLIPEEPFPFEQLDLPMQIRNVADTHRGLFLVCGITGSGKSTTLASMLDHINATRHAHIITIEDPIEFVYTDKKSIISQRQVGRDTYSFANALRGALREDPDVILVGEMRDVDTIRAALSAAETGHLVFSTLHTMTAVDTVNRIISYFPQNERELIRQELAYTLRGVACQRLLRRQGGGRVPCVELLLGGMPIVRDSILEGDIQRLNNIIEVDSEMKTFDQYAVELFKKGTVSREEAISACSDEQGFNRSITGIKGTEGRKLLNR